MSKSLMIVSILVLFVLGSLTIGLTQRWLVSAQSQKDTDAPAPRLQPYSQVDEKASAVNGPDEGAIRDLADAVLRFVTGNKVPSVFIGPYKERLVRTEINYRSGQKVGIPEENIVRVFDELAQALNAPACARTDEEEVREIRLAISQMIPHLIVPQYLGAEEQSSTGLPYTVTPTMSPLEAVFVTRFLIMQKEINEFSQITPDERAEIKIRINKLAEAGFHLTPQERGEVMRALIKQTLHPEKTQLSAEELAQQVQQQRDRPKYRASVYLIAGNSSSRYNKMQDLFRRAYTMKVSDAIALTNRSLELLGIEK
ncbi:MAG TPA: hypothetical protein VGJ66_24840 [Pyrinomonadaceae bacterium]|jgi:hypothetical protein